MKAKKQFCKSKVVSPWQLVDCAQKIVGAFFHIGGERTEAAFLENSLLKALGSLHPKSHVRESLFA